MGLSLKERAFDAVPVVPLGPLTPVFNRDGVKGVVTRVHGDQERLLVRWTLDIGGPTSGCIVLSSAVRIDLEEPTGRLHAIIGRLQLPCAENIASQLCNIAQNVLNGVEGRTDSIRVLEALQVAAGWGIR